MIRIYTQIQQGEGWLQRYRGSQPLFACILGFTETGLIPGISAAGATPESRRYTAIADAEFLYYGPQSHPKYPLPPLHAGASPVLLSRAVVEALEMPVYLFNAGLPQPPAVPVIDLGGCPAKCLSQGAAMPLTTVKHLLKQGLLWGEQLASKINRGYLIISECVVGGTTTALAVLTGLGIPAAGKVNSSHPVCNHHQKWEVVQAGLGHWLKAGGQGAIFAPASFTSAQNYPLELVAAVGDPMQVVAAGMAIAASRSCGVLLAGGTQMLAVYALMGAIAQQCTLSWCPQQVVVGTTRWVAEDSTGNTVELAQLINTDGFSPPLFATQLSFANSRFTQLQAYEQGYVKEGVGAGGACIAAHLTQGWNQRQLLTAIEDLCERYRYINAQ
jgi:uncharacterized protein (TIGR00303 family)